MKNVLYEPSSRFCLVASISVWVSTKAGAMVDEMIAKRYLMDGWYLSSDFLLHDR